MRIAIVGTGISGLAAAWRLKEHAQLTVFEAGSHFGGHTHTVDATVGSMTYPVDTGFLVLNRRTYPGLLSLFTELHIPIAESDMSFSVQRLYPSGRRLEWSGANLNTVFAQRANLLRPRFWRMLGDILRFNREATELAEAAQPALADTRSVRDFLHAGRYSDDFAHGYFLPMAACIWSCPTSQMLDFPVATMARFCHNHGLLQVTKRPQWLTVRGGARQYVERIVTRLPDARLNTPVRRVKRFDMGVEVSTDTGTEWFDHVILACHSDQALALLADASQTEREVLGAIRYQPNRAVLHTDTHLLPRNPRAWAAWNYESAMPSERHDLGRTVQPTVCLHYLINKLQPVPFDRPVMVTMNPVREPEPSSVLRQIDYAHPVFDTAAVAAQSRIPELQGRRRTFYCGAWCGYGFHEDGLKAGYAAANALLAQASRHALESLPSMQAEVM
ncbi:MAG: FAD-dependent oxidoreductase [Betaproteobacteria bacterium]|jgi:predicted NAD/FAD-binding protein|nr:FAD-dependent oxidoreductase [Betaproteobacteria bacterium]